MGIILKFAGV